MRLGTLICPHHVAGAGAFPHHDAAARSPEAESVLKYAVLYSTLVMPNGISSVALFHEL